ATGYVDRFLHLFPNLVTLKADRRGGENTSFTESVSKAFNPMPTAWFQSINALGIFVIAPIFAWMWIWLDRRGWQPSIPLKMFLGLVMMSLSVALMIEAARHESQSYSVTFDRKKLPAAITVNADGALGFVDDDGQAGRLILRDAELFDTGVLADTERDRIVGATVPADFRKALKELEKAAKDLKKGDQAEVKLGREPPGFDMRYAGLKKSEVRYDPK